MLGYAPPEVFGCLGMILGAGGGAILGMGISTLFCTNKDCLTMFALFGAIIGFAISGRYTANEKPETNKGE